MRAEIDDIVARAGERPEAALHTFRALEQCDAALAAPEDFRTTFACYQNQRTAVLVERTYEEMVASGAIAGVFSGLRNYKSFLDSVRISLPVIDRVLWRDLDLSYDNEVVPRLRDFEFEAAWNSA